MANRTYTHPWTLGKGRVYAGGSFAPNGSSAIVDTSNVGDVDWSVAFTSTGLFTVTLVDSFLYLVEGRCALQLAAGDDKIVQFGAIDVVTAKTVELRVWDISAAAVANIAAAAGNRIHFGLVLKNSSSGGRR